MNLDRVSIRKKIEAVFADALSNEKAAKVGFHMTDWLDETVDLLEAFEKTNSVDEEIFEKRMISCSCYGSFGRGK